MQRVFADDGVLAYQEIGTASGEVLDSLLVGSVVSEQPLGTYLQQQINQLRLKGYLISDIVTKKMVHKQTDASLTAILKIYQIVNEIGTHLYMAQYVVQGAEKIIVVSFASEELAARKQFVKSIKNLTF